MNQNYELFFCRKTPWTKRTRPWTMTWSVHHGLMAALAVHLARAHALGRYVASNFTAKTSTGRARRWEPNHIVGWWWGVQKLADDEEEWRRVSGAR
jgi:hypothetical protein